MSQDENGSENKKSPIRKKRALPAAPSSTRRVPASRKTPAPPPRTNKIRNSKLKKAFGLLVGDVECPKGVDVEEFKKSNRWKAYKILGVNPYELNLMLKIRDKVNEVIGEGWPIARLEKIGLSERAIDLALEVALRGQSKEGKVIEALQDIRIDSYNSLSKEGRLIRALGLLVEEKQHVTGNKKFFKDKNEKDRPIKGVMAYEILGVDPDKPDLLGQIAVKIDELIGSRVDKTSVNYTLQRILNEAGPNALDFTLNVVNREYLKSDLSYVKKSSKKEVVRALSDVMKDGIASQEKEEAIKRESEISVNGAGIDRSGATMTPPPSPEPIFAQEEGDIDGVLAATDIADMLELLSRGDEGLNARVSEKIKQMYGDHEGFVRETGDVIREMYEDIKDEDIEKCYEKLDVGLDARKVINDFHREINDFKYQNEDDKNGDFAYVKAMLFFNSNAVSDEAKVLLYKTLTEGKDDVVKDGAEDAFKYYCARNPHVKDLCNLPDVALKAEGLSVVDIVKAMNLLVGHKEPEEAYLSKEGCKIKAYNLLEVDPKKPNLTKQIQDKIRGNLPSRVIYDVDEVIYGSSGMSNEAKALFYKIQIDGKNGNEEQRVSAAAFASHFDGLNKVGQASLRKAHNSTTLKDIKGDELEVLKEKTLGEEKISRTKRIKGALSGVVKKVTGRVRRSSSGDDEKIRPIKTNKAPAKFTIAHELDKVARGGWDKPSIDERTKVFDFMDVLNKSGLSGEVIEEALNIVDAMNLLVYHRKPKQAYLSKEGCKKTAYNLLEVDPDKPDLDDQIRGKIEDVNRHFKGSRNEECDSIDKFIQMSTASEKAKTFFNEIRDDVGAPHVDPYVPKSETVLNSENSAMGKLVQVMNLLLLDKGDRVKAYNLLGVDSNEPDLMIQIRGKINEVAKSLNDRYGEEHNSVDKLFISTDASEEAKALFCQIRRGGDSRDGMSNIGAVNEWSNLGDNFWQHLEKVSKNIDAIEKDGKAANVERSGDFKYTDVAEPENVKNSESSATETAIENFMQNGGSRGGGAGMTPPASPESGARPNSVTGVKGAEPLRQGFVNARA